MRFLLRLMRAAFVPLLFGAAAMFWAATSPARGNEVPTDSVYRLDVPLVDQDGRPMFQQGTSEPMPYTKKLLSVIGGIVSSLPNRVSVSGHTAVNDVAATGGSWELSASRANQARVLLQAGGLYHKMYLLQQGVRDAGL